MVPVLKLAQLPSGIPHARGQMKPTRVVYESHAEAEERLRRKADTDGLCQDTERERARFKTATELVAWFFAMAGHMASAPAIDPSADVIQGARVDRDERLSWIGCGRQALKHLADAQGNNTGVLLLWLHLRPSRVTGYVVKRGMRIPVSSHPVPLWELHQDPTVKAVSLSRRDAVRAYWDALRRVEEFAFSRHWIAARAARKPRAPNVYRRDSSSEGNTSET